MPPAHELIEIERLACDLALAAGRQSVGSFRQHLRVEYKGEGLDNPVTEVDRAAEDLIRQGIAARFPDHCVIGEERQDRYRPDTNYIWVIDPVDGTTNFVNGLPIFACSIGVLHRFRPVVGAIFVPNGTSTGPGVFRARHGGGAHFNEDPLNVTGEVGLIQGRTVARPGSFPTGFTIRKEIRQKLGEPRVLGSIAYELCYVAAGTLGYALFGSARIWDIAAGVVLVKEAGGRNLVYRSRGGWQEFTHFEPIKANAKESLEHFRGPMPPLMAGNPGIVAQLAGGLGVRRAGWLKSVQRKLKTRGK